MQTFVLLSYKQTNLAPVQNYNFYQPGSNERKKYFKLPDNFEIVLSNHDMLIPTIIKFGNFRDIQRKKCIVFTKNLILVVQ